MVTNINQLKNAPLCGQVDSSNLKTLDRQCTQLKNLGFAGVMTNVFIAIEPLNADLTNRQILFSDDDAHIVMLTQHQRSEIKKILQHHDLPLLSCHFLQTLQPFDKTPQWILPIHDQLLEAAAFAGAKTVTTHFGWMFGEANQKYMGQHIQQLNTNQISRDQFLNEKIKRCGGKQKIIDDSLIIYDHLTRQAAQHDITVTIETVPGPLGMGHPKNIRQFIDTLNADNLAICIDSGHCQAINLSPAQAIRAAAEKMIETHFHDNFGPQKSWPLSDMHLPVGVGITNWLDVIHALLEINYQGPITFEQKDPQTNLQNWKALLAAAEKLQNA